MGRSLKISCERNAGTISLYEKHIFPGYRWEAFPWALVFEFPGSALAVKKS